MLVGIFGVGVAVFGKAAQLHARQVLHGDARQRTTVQHARQETFHIRADPVQQIHRLHLAYVGRARSEEHTSELQSLMRISYAVFCLKKKKTYYTRTQ